jgi:DeoR/GlpR family transcriptional regulator of sugar metabolism
MASLDEFAREQAILTELNAAGRVVVNELAQMFGVSTVTIRKDLDALERRALLRRVRGGAVSVGSGDEGAFEMRLRHSRDAKRGIAAAVAPLVRHGDVIAVDSSTTGYYLAHELLDRRDLVVITNGLRVAMLLMEQSSATVLMLGGVLRRASGSMVGPIGDVLAGRGRVDKGFFGATGISVTHGLLDLSSEEASTKQFMAQACGQVYGLIDSSKIGGFGLHSFCAADGVEAIFTDDGIEDTVVAQWAEVGVPVHAVPAEPAGSAARAAGGTAGTVVGIDAAGRR